MKTNGFHSLATISVGGTCHTVHPTAHARFPNTKGTVVVIYSVFILSIIEIGDESYDNQVKYGGQTFAELESIQIEGLIFEGQHHRVDVVSCCDWKAGACIEGMFHIQNNQK